MRRAGACGETCPDAVKSDAVKGNLGAPVVLCTYF